MKKVMSILAVVAFVVAMGLNVKIGTNKNGNMDLSLMTEMHISQANAEAKLSWSYHGWSGVGCPGYGVLCCYDNE